MSYLYLTVIIIIIIIAVALVLLFVGSSPPITSKVMEGTFFVSDAGSSHGGFEYTAEWNVTLTISDGTGTLKLVQRIGLGDPLKNHEYQVSELSIETKKISMKIDGQPITIIFVEKDKIWSGEYDNYFIASWGGYAPSEEMIGTISPKIFTGLPDHYYVELRLKQA